MTICNFLIDRDEDHRRPDPDGIFRLSCNFANRVDATMSSSQDSLRPPGTSFSFHTDSRPLRTIQHCTEPNWILHERGDDGAVRSRSRIYSKHRKRGVRRCHSTCEHASGNGSFHHRRGISNSIMDATETDRFATGRNFHHWREGFGKCGDDRSGTSKIISKPGFPSSLAIDCAFTPKRRRLHDCWVLRPSCHLRWTLRSSVSDRLFEGFTKSDGSQQPVSNCH